MERSKAPALAPGDLHTPSLPLSRFRQPWISGAVTAYSLYTPDHAPVLVLGNHHGNTIRELVTAGHRAIALNANPIPLLWMHCQLNPVPVEAIQRAITNIAHSDKAGRRLIQYIQELYATECPNCHKTIQVMSYVWDRDANLPFQKVTTCPYCGTYQTASLTSQDQEKHERLTRQARPAFHITLQQVAPRGTAFRERATELLNLYTPLNLSILSAILRQFPRCSDDANVKRTIACILLEALDVGSMLNPVEEPKQRPRSLRPAITFYEHNVWQRIQQTIQCYADMHFQQCNPNAENLNDLLSTETPGYVLLARSLQYLKQHSGLSSVDYVIWQLDPPDTVFTSLSALWAGWLWGHKSHRSMNTLTNKRRHDLPWFEGHLETQANILSATLPSKANIIILVPAASPAVLAVTRRIMAKHGYGLVKWTGTSAGDSYLLFTQDDQVDTGYPPTLERYAQEVLLARGYATPVSLITAGYAIEHSYVKSINIKSLSQSETVTLVKDELQLSKRPMSLTVPLYDQVEKAIIQCLRRQETWTRSKLLNAVYARYQGTLCPNLDYVDTCISAYASASPENIITLRPEDKISARDADVIRSKHMLQALGKRLGYQVHSAPNGDYLWQEGTVCDYRFRVIIDAQIATHLLGATPECEGRRCLVVPGGRAGLVAYKLNRDLRLRDAVSSGKWTFIKFRHIRRMEQDITQRSEIEVFLGLDPIAEQTQAQIPLPLT